MDVSKNSAMESATFFSEIKKGCKVSCVNSKNVVKSRCF